MEPHERMKLLEALFESRDALAAKYVVPHVMHLLACDDGGGVALTVGATGICTGAG